MLGIDVVNLADLTVEELSHWMRPRQKCQISGMNGGSGSWSVSHRHGIEVPRGQMCKWTKTTISVPALIPKAFHHEPDESQIMYGYSYSMNGNYHLKNLQ